MYWSKCMILHVHFVHRFVKIAVDRAVHGVYIGIMNKTEKQLQAMTRKQLSDYAWEFCSERDLCKEYGGWQPKAIMVANILQRQNQIGDNDGQA
jgi:hypothetical protein